LHLAVRAFLAAGLLAAAGLGVGQAALIGASTSPAVQAAGAVPDVAGVSATLVGDETEYTVRAGDSLALIGARFGVAPRLVAAANGLRASDVLKPDTVLRIDHRHIVPAGAPDGILINIPQRFLFHVVDGQVRAAYPVALGRPDWRTPTGAFTVANKQQDKPWIVPKSIQEEMRREGKPVLTRVEPGPENPLGRHWIGLSLDSLGIHGTIAPTSIYGLRSHGCIRLHPDDVAELFDRVEVGTPGALIYQPALLAALPDGRVFVEVNPDAYRRGPEPLAHLKSLADRAGLSDRIDWGKVAAAVRDREGVAREVGAAAPPANGAKAP